MSALSGWRVLVPRPPGRNSSLVSLLSTEGAVVQAIPMISIEPPADTGALDAAALTLAAGEYSWVGFTSVNALAAVLDRAAHLALSPAIPADIRVAAVGPATAAALRSAGIPVDLVPGHSGSAAVLGAIWPSAHTGESVLLPQSEIAAPLLLELLQQKAYRVDVVTAYRTVPLPPTRSIAADLAAGGFDAVLLTSASTARALAKASPAPGTVLGAIGPSTAAAAAAAGLEIAYIATDPSDSGLVTGLKSFAEQHRIGKQS